MLKKNIETFLGCDREYDEAKIVLFGAPLTLQLHIDQGLVLLVVL